jgi:hypothetical protein
MPWTWMMNRKEISADERRKAGQLRTKIYNNVNNNTYMTTPMKGKPEGAEEAAPSSSDR